MSGQGSGQNPVPLRLVISPQEYYVYNSDTNKDSKDFLLNKFKEKKQEEVKFNKYIQELKLKALDFLSKTITLDLQFNNSLSEFNKSLDKEIKRCNPNEEINNVDAFLNHLGRAKGEIRVTYNDFKIIGQYHENRQNFEISINKEFFEKFLTAYNSSDDSTQGKLYNKFYEKLCEIMKNIEYNLSTPLLKVEFEERKFKNIESIIKAIDEKCIEIFGEHHECKKPEGFDKITAFLTKNNLEQLRIHKDKYDVVSRTFKPYQLEYLRNPDEFHKNIRDFFNNYQVQMMKNPKEFSDLVKLFFNDVEFANPRMAELLNDERKSFIKNPVRYIGNFNEILTKQQLLQIISPVMDNDKNSRLQNFINKFFTDSQKAAIRNQKSETVYFNCEQMVSFRDINPENSVFFSDEQLQEFSQKVKTIQAVLNFFTEEQLNSICFTHNIELTDEQMQYSKNPAVVFFSEEQIESFKLSSTIDKKTVYICNPFVTFLTIEQIRSLQDLNPISLTEEQIKRLTNCSEIITCEQQYNHYIENELLYKTNTKICVQEQEIQERIDKKLNNIFINILADKLFRGAINDKVSISREKFFQVIKLEVFQKLLPSLFDNEFIQNNFDNDYGLIDLTKEQLLYRLKNIFNEDFRNILKDEILKRIPRKLDTTFINSLADKLFEQADNDKIWVSQENFYQFILNVFSYTKFPSALDKQFIKDKFNKDFGIQDLTKEELRAKFAEIFNEEICDTINKELSIMQLFMTEQQLLSQESGSEEISMKKIDCIKSPQEYRLEEIPISALKFYDDQIIVLNDPKEIKLMSDDQIDFFKSNSMITISDDQIHKFGDIPELDEVQKNILQGRDLSSMKDILTNKQKDILTRFEENLSKPLITFFTKEKLEQLKGSNFDVSINEFIPEEIMKYIILTKKQLNMCKNLLTTEQIEKFRNPSANLYNFFTKDQLSFFRNGLIDQSSFDVILTQEQREFFKIQSSFSELMGRAFSFTKVDNNKTIYEYINDALKTRNWVTRRIKLKDFPLKNVIEIKLDKYSKIFWHLYKFSSVIVHYSQNCSPINISNIIFCTKETDVNARINALIYEEDKIYTNYIIIVGPEFLSQQQQNALRNISNPPKKNKIIIFTASEERFAINKFTVNLNEEDLVKIENNVESDNFKNLSIMQHFDELRDKVHLVFNLLPGANPIKKLMKDHHYVTFYVSPNDPQIPSINYFDKDVYLTLDSEIATDNSVFFHQLYQFAFFKITNNFVENNFQKDRNLYIEFPSIGVLNNLDDFPFPVKPENVHVLKPDYFTDQIKFEDNRLIMKNSGIVFNNGKVKVNDQDFGVEVVIDQEEYIGKTLQNVLDNIKKNTLSNEDEKYHDLLVKLYNIFFETPVQYFSLCTLRSLSTYFDKYYKWLEIGNYRQYIEEEMEKKTILKGEIKEITVQLQLFFLQSAFVVCTQNAFKNKRSVFMLPYDMFSPNKIENYVMQIKMAENIHQYIRENRYKVDIPEKIYKFFKTAKSEDICDYWPNAHKLIGLKDKNNDVLRSNIFIKECNNLLAKFECIENCKYIVELCKTVENSVKIENDAINWNFQTLEEERERKNSHSMSLRNVSKMFATFSCAKTSFIRYCILLSRIAAQIPYCLTGETGCGKTYILEFLKEAFRIFEHDSYVFIVIDVNAETSIEDYINAKKDYILPGTNYQLISGEQHIHIIFDEANTSFICPQLFYEMSQISKLPTHPFYSLSSGCIINKVSETNEITDEMASNNVEQDLAQGKSKKEHDYILTSDYIKNSKKEIQLKYFVNEQTNLISEYEIDYNPFTIDDEKDEFMLNEEEIHIKGIVRYFLSYELGIDEKIKKYQEIDENIRKEFYRFVPKTLVESIRFTRYYYNDRAAASYRDIDFVCHLLKDILQNDFKEVNKNNLYNAFFIAIFFRFVGRLPKKFKFMRKQFADHLKLWNLYQLAKIKKSGENIINPRLNFLEYLFLTLELPKDIKIKKPTDVLELFRKTSYRISKDIFDCNKEILLFDALAEHFYAIIVCSRTGFSTFLLGQPGTSKSFSCKALMNYKGNKLQPIKYAVFHSNRTCTSNGLKILFEECARQKLFHLMDKFVFITFIEEIGLLTNSVYNPTKILHEILVKGVLIHNKRVKIPVVAFSNYRLDFSNMNRAIIFFTDKYEKEDFERAVAFKAIQDARTDEGNKDFDAWYNEFLNAKASDKSISPPGIYDKLLAKIENSEKPSMREIFSDYFEILRNIKKFKETTISGDHMNLIYQIKSPLARETFMDIYNLNVSIRQNISQKDSIGSFYIYLTNRENTFRKGCCVVSPGYAFALAYMDKPNIFEDHNFLRNYIFESDFAKTDDEIFKDMLKVFKMEKDMKKEKLVHIVGYPKPMDTMLDLTNSNDTEFTHTCDDEKRYGHAVVTNDIFGVRFDADERFRILLSLPTAKEVKGPILDRFDIYNFTLDEIKEKFYKGASSDLFSVNYKFDDFKKLYDSVVKVNNNKSSFHLIQTNSRMMYENDFKEMLDLTNSDQDHKVIIKLYNQEIKDSQSFVDRIKKDTRENNWGLQNTPQFIINLTEFNTESFIALLHKLRTIELTTNYFFIVYNCKVELQSLPFCPIYDIDSLDNCSSGMITYKCLKDLTYELTCQGNITTYHFEAILNKQRCKDDLKYWINTWLKPIIQKELNERQKGLNLPKLSKVDFEYSIIVKIMEQETHFYIIKLIFWEITTDSDKSWINYEKNEDRCSTAIKVFYNYRKLSVKYPIVKKLLDLESKIDEDIDNKENFSSIFGSFRDNKRQGILSLEYIDEIEDILDQHIAEEIIYDVNKKFVDPNDSTPNILDTLTINDHGSVEYNLMQFLHSLREQLSPAIFVALMCCTSLKDSANYHSIEKIFEIDQDLKNQFWNDSFKDLSQNDESIYHYLSNKDFFDTENLLLLGRDKVLCMSKKEIKKSFEGININYNGSTNRKDEFLNFLYAVMKHKYTHSEKIENSNLVISKEKIQNDPILKLILEDEMEFTTFPIGYVRSDCKQLGEVPLNGKDDILGGVIEILPQFSECLVGLENVKHIWVFSFLHLADRSIQQVQPVHMRHLPPRGVFATCSPVRPNPIGKSFMEIQKIEGLKIYVKGLDLVDGTPILDIKLYDEGSDQPIGL